MTLHPQSIGNSDRQTRRHNCKANANHKFNSFSGHTWRIYSLVLEYLLGAFHVEFMFVHNFLEIFDSLVEHVIVSRQM